MGLTVSSSTPTTTSSSTSNFSYTPAQSTEVAGTMAFNTSNASSTICFA